MNITNQLKTRSGQAIADLRRALEERDNQLIVLQSLMDDLLAYEALDPLLQKIAEIMISYSAAAQSLILLVNETEEHITVVACAGDHVSNNLGYTRDRGVGFAGVAWDTGETQYISNSDHNVLTRGYWPTGTQLLAVPLKVNTQVIGVCVVGASSNEANLSNNATVVNNLANLASFAIATANALDKTKQDLQHSRGIREISHQLSSINDTGELLTAVSKTLVVFFEYRRCTFFVVNEHKELDVKNNIWTHNNNVMDSEFTLPPELIPETSYYWSYKHKEIAIINRQEKDPRESERVREYRKKLNIGCSVAIPVIVSGDVVAVLLVCRDFQQRDCDENELNLLSSIVQQLSSAVYGTKVASALRHQAFHDSLTELPNRRFFEEHLQQSLENSENKECSGALLYLDLDGFKAINDTMGHSAGDALLQTVARRLEQCVEDTDFIARLGGDEFAIVLHDVHSPHTALTTAQRIRKIIINPITVANSIINIGTSIGLCFYPANGDTIDTLLRNADTAMYNAKSDGKNNVVCFEHSMATKLHNKNRLDSQMLNALDCREFVLHYQPQVDPITGCVESVEALVRWIHPERGMVPPLEFIPMAEETGFINEIGAWVLQESVNQLDKWKNTRLGNLKIAVNIAASQFLTGDFCSRVEQRLKQYNVPPTMLEVELTESAVMKDVNQVADQLNALRKLGVTVALDDFGTGYSSLSHLQDLPIDVLKIDRAFVAALSDERTDNTIANTIMLLASGLGLKTVAEGVETSSQLDKIMELGCTLVQGYYFSKPCSIEALESTVITIEEQFHARTAA